MARGKVEETARMNPPEFKADDWRTQIDAAESNAEAEEEAKRKTEEEARRKAEEKACADSDEGDVDEEYSVRLVLVPGASREKVIEIVRCWTGLDAANVRALVDGLQIIETGLSAVEAEKLQRELIKVGAVVSITSSNSTSATSSAEDVRTREAEEAQRQAKADAKTGEVGKEVRGKGVRRNETKKQRVPRVQLYRETVGGLTWIFRIGKSGKAIIGCGEGKCAVSANGIPPIGSVIIPAYLGECPVAGIGAYAFAGCRSLTSVTIPDSVTSIGDHAFSGCSGLSSVTIPDSVTSIGAYAFANCSGLTSITIPRSFTIGEGAFSGLSGLSLLTKLLLFARLVRRAKS